LLIALLVPLLTEEPKPEVEELELAASAFVGGARMLDEAVGVYSTEPVVAFDPAEAEPEAENEVEAPGPDVPDDALA
jgi:hypothetical protein